MHAFRYVKPLLNLPTVDLFGYALMRQHSRCANLEMKCLECIEYYGAHRGSIICQDYYDDWKECASTNLSVRFKLTHLKSRCNFQFNLQSCWLKAWTNISFSEIKSSLNGFAVQEKVLGILPWRKRVSISTDSSSSRIFRASQNTQKWFLWRKRWLNIDNFIEN